MNESNIPSLEQQEEGEAIDLGNTIRKIIRTEGEGGKYSETVQVRPGGELGLEDSNGELKSYLVHLASDGPEELLKLARRVEKVCPDLSFKFERDYDQHTISYSVTEKNELSGRIAVDTK